MYSEHLYRSGQCGGRVGGESFGIVACVSAPCLSLLLVTTLQSLLCFVSPPHLLFHSSFCLHWREWNNTSEIHTLMSKMLGSKSGKVKMTNVAGGGIDVLRFGLFFSIFTTTILFLIKVFLDNSTITSEQFK